MGNNHGINSRNSLPSKAKVSRTSTIGNGTNTKVSQKTAYLGNSGSGGFADRLSRNLQKK